jgi:very-short-patch-repair endonuclease
METKDRFPQELGNLATNARFPHSHKPMMIVLGKKEEPGTGNQSVTYVSGLICYRCFRLHTRGGNQHPIPPFITDFCCVERRLVVELDGSQHAATPEEDLRRTQFLQSQGYKVLRFWDTEVLQQLDAVVEVIQRAVQAPSP